MSSRRVSNFSDLIQRVAASCLLHPAAACRRRQDVYASGDESDDDDEEDKCSEDETTTEEEEEPEDGGGREREVVPNSERRRRRMTDDDVEMLMEEVFEAVSEMKRAYISLQAAHSPWDPDKMRAADAAVVAELKRLGVMRETFRRRARSGCTRKRRERAVAAVREIVAPYEAVVEELKRELKAKEIEIDNMREKLLLNTTTKLVVQGGRSHHHRHQQSKRRVSCSATQTPHVAASPVPELFEATMGLVKETSKSYTATLLSLMRSAHWDMAAAVRSIEAASANVSVSTTTGDVFMGPHHAKYAVESYVIRKMFQGFDHETFYMDGSLSSLLDPDQFRRDCFTQYRDMKSMDPTELLGVLPTCPFGNFCSRKYLAILHPKMEESLFGGDLEQRHLVLSGNHPRTHFYGQFLALAKAVWLLHLLAFSLDPPPRQLDVNRGGEFQPEYMESVLTGATSHVDQIVGIPVLPGFKLGNGSVIKARVYLVPRTTV